MANTQQNPFGLNFNKYMAEYNKYSPYLKFGADLAKGGNVAKSASEAYLDKMASSVPGYGEIYKGVKLFNQATGGVNFNKMFHIKNPITQAWNGLWHVKKPKTPEEQAAEDPEYAKYMSMLSDMQNSSAAAERSALEKRQAIQPMQEKAVSDYMDILQNGLSSRQLAPIYAAGESRNRAIGAAAEAGLMSQVANRGMGGGVQAGLETAVQANRNALSADLNSRITGQQIAARPGMLGQAVNMTMGLENQLQQELAQAGMNRLNAANVGLQAYNAAQQNKRLQQQIEFEKQNARNQEMGYLLGTFGPDIAKGIQGLINKGKPAKTESVEAVPDSTFNGVDAGGGWLGTDDNPTPNIPLSMVQKKVAADGSDYYAPRDSGWDSDITPLHSMNDVSIQPTTAGLRSIGQPGQFGFYNTEFGPNAPVSLQTQNLLSQQYPNAQIGEQYPGPNGATYRRTVTGWEKFYLKQVPSGPLAQPSTGQFIGGTVFRPFG